jgi:hypothetical protein
VLGADPGTLWPPYTPLAESAYCVIPPLTFAKNSQEIGRMLGSLTIVLDFCVTVTLNSLA